MDRRKFLASSAALAAASAPLPSGFLAQPPRAKTTYALTADYRPFVAVLNELKSLHLPNEVSQTLLDMSDDWTKFVRSESVTTIGAGVAFTFYPSDRLVALLAAARAANLN